MTIMQDNDGNLMVLDKDGEVVLKAPRKRPAYDKNVKAEKFTEELVGDIHQMARLGIVLITRKDHEASRF